MQTTITHDEILLGRYRVLQTNTSGGFGSVCVCWDARLQRRGAIKRMPLYLNDGTPQQASTMEEARAEARTSSMLAHPNIVTMFDFETDDTYSYLVMEYVDGLNLAELLARVEDGVLSFDECAHVVNSVASALAYAHENGVLHLDIKPANIMIDRSGTVKLGDFGMASLASAAGYGGARGGTVGYMSPEQVEGGMVDERSDVFSLAVVVWQALTGHCPYAAPTPEQSLELIYRGPSPTLSRMEPALAGVVENTLLRALEPFPNERMASVKEFAHNLVRALGDTEEGSESLADLLNQTEEDEEPRPIGDWNRIHVPLYMRLPWVAVVLPRVLAAATAGWVAHLVIPSILPNSSTALAFGSIGVAVASAAWPPMAGLLGGLSLVGAIMAQPSNLAFPLALAIGIVGIIWWAFAGRQSPFAGSALLLPGCLSSPLTGVGLAGLCLTPGAALCTGTLSLTFGILLHCGVTNGFVADAMLLTLRDYLVDPLVWALALGCGLASFGCALISRRRTTGRCIAGQVVAVVVLTLTYLACAHMENASIAATVDATALGVAVFLGATLCIVNALMGESISYRKGDDRA